MLPRKPERSQPIPNEPFESPEVSSIKGPYWSMPLGSGLESDGQGSIQTSGSEPSAPTAYLYGTNGFVGVGAGLQIGSNGELEQGGGYIYCTPQFSNLPVTYPPYNCETAVNTAGVTNFTRAWYDCGEISELPCVNSSSVTDFTEAWKYCDGLTSFPVINTGMGKSFYYSWAYTGLTSFPRLNTGMGSNFYGAWAGCYYMAGEFPKLDFSNAEELSYAWIYSGNGSPEPLDFPEGIFDSCSKNNIRFRQAWYSCSLSEQSVDNIIKSLDSTGTMAGYLEMGNCGSLPSQAVIESNVSSLWDKGWVVVLDDGSLGIPEPSFGCSTAVNTAGLEYLPLAWINCTSLTSFPSLDVSSCKVFYRAWQSCSSLTSFPGTLDLSSGVNFEGAWQSCSSLTSFPGTLDLSSGTNFQGAWGFCTSLTSFPGTLDLSSGTNFAFAWGFCTSLTSFPLLNVSQGNNFSGAWLNCTSLTSFPGTLDLSSGTNFSDAWYNCNSLTSFPGTLDLSSGTNFQGAWGSCTSLTSFPGTLNLSSGTNFSIAWYNCNSLTSFPGTLDLSSGTNFPIAWQNCTSLTSFPAGMFDNCSAINFSGAWLNCALSQQSVDNILVSLDTAGQSDGSVTINGGTSSAPGASGAAAKASLQAKGWTVLTN